MNKDDKTNISFYTLIKKEFFTISTSYAILVVLIGGVIGYGFLYNFMYAPNDVTNAPVVIVDNSKTELSRRFIYKLDATPEVQVVGTGEDYIQAKDLMARNQAAAIMFIPYDFDDKIRTGRQAISVAYETTQVFLYSLYIQKAITFTVLDLNNEIRPDQLVFLPKKDVQIMASSSSPIQAVGIPLYNYTEGYGTYLIPAVLMAIFFQTLMMVTAMITGDEISTKKISYYEPLSHSFRGLAKLVFAKAFVYVLIYLVFAYFYIGLLAKIFDLPAIGDTRTIIIMLIPYLFATSFFGLTMSLFWSDADAPIPVIAFFSVGLIFLSGISYPLELMPKYWQWSQFIFPAGPGILSYVKINSMGCKLPEVRQEYLTLFCQVVIYFVTAMLVYKRNINKYKPENPEVPADNTVINDQTSVKNNDIASETVN